MLIHIILTTFLDYGVTRGSENVPDISGHLEKTLTDSNFQKPVSDEAYSRFRKALGKLLWLSQVRHDLRRHGCLFLGRSKRNRCTELNKH